jgi:hypothetical protein
MHNISRLQMAAVAMLVMAAACAKDDDADDAALPADSMALAPAPGSEAPPAAPVVTQLAAVGSSGVTGQATATHTPTDVTVAINVTGAPAGDLPAHIHTGTCAAGGPVAVELTKVTNGQSSTTVPLSSLPANQSSFVQVHDASGKPIACGDMQGHGDNMNHGAATTTGATTTTY